MYLYCDSIDFLKLRNIPIKSSNTYCKAKDLGNSMSIWIVLFRKDSQMYWGRVGLGYFPDLTCPSQVPRDEAT